MSDKKADIFRCGKELFSSKGFKDTNVSDITKLAGVAVGTFYNYYPSKEKLFMDIFLQENVILKKGIMEAIDPDGDPFAVMQEVMARNAAGMDAHPILREWNNREVFARIEQQYREDNGLAHVDFMYSHFTELVRKWQAGGKMRSDIDSGMIMALFHSIVHVEAHKNEIGIQFFPQLLNYLSEFIMNGLTEQKHHQKG